MQNSQTDNQPKYKNNDFFLITGASQGIGEAISLELASKGYNLLLVARNKQKLETLKTEYENNQKIQVKIFPADLSEPASINHIYKFTKDQKINIVGLVNNAGFGEYKSFLNTPIQRDLDMNQVNMTSLMHLTKLFALDMLSLIENDKYYQQNQPMIMNVASVAGFLAGPYFANYYATKAYVLSFSQAIHHELLGKIKVSCLCPGQTISNFQKEADMMNSKFIKATKNTAMTSAQVAKIGVEGMFKGKAIVVPGLPKLLVAILPFIPRSWARKVVGDLQSENTIPNNV
jgi:short-subunit dehydrogenase